MNCCPTCHVWGCAAAEQNQNFSELDWDWDWETNNEEMKGDGDTTPLLMLLMVIWRALAQFNIVWWLKYSYRPLTAQRFQNLTFCFGATTSFSSKKSAWLALFWQERHRWTASYLSIHPPGAISSRFLPAKNAEKSTRKETRKRGRRSHIFTAQWTAHLLS